jgi:hypothetical protein
MTIHHFQSRQDAHRPRSSWHHLIDVAATQAEVLARLRDFAASFTPYEIEQLPEALRPGKLVDATDVAGYAIDLYRSDVQGADAHEVLHAFADVVGYAAARLAMLTDQRIEQDQQSA